MASKILTGANIKKFTLALLLIAVLFPPLREQPILYFHGRFFLLTMPDPWYFISVSALFLECLVILLFGCLLYTFKKG